MGNYPDMIKELKESLEEEEGGAGEEERGAGEEGENTPAATYSAFALENKIEEKEEFTPGLRRDPKEDDANVNEKPEIKEGEKIIDKDDVVTPEEFEEIKQQLEEEWSISSAFADETLDEIYKIIKKYGKEKAEEFVEENI